MLFVCALVLSFGTLAFAQTDTTTNTNQQNRETLKNEINGARNTFNQGKLDVRNQAELEKENIKTAETDREQMKADIEKIREDAKQKIESLKATAQGIKNKAKATIAQARILGREEALQRFDQAIEKINALKDKVNTQIAKLDARGIDTQKAKDLVATADAKILEAKSKTAEASTLLASSTNELTKENKTKLVGLTQDIQTLINDAHGALNDATKYIKTLVVANPVPVTGAVNQ